MLYIKGVKYQQQMAMPDVLRSPDATFDSYCADGPFTSWTDTDFSREVITNIDGVNVRDTSRSTRELLFLEGIKLEELATGTKNLILCKYFESKKFERLYNRLGFMGENCFKYLVQAAIDRDIYMVTTVFREFPARDMFPLGGVVCFEDNGFIARDTEGWIRGMLDVGNLGLFEA